VANATRCTTEETRFDSRQKQKLFSSPKQPDQLWDPRSLLGLLSVGKVAEA